MVLLWMKGYPVTHFYTWASCNGRTKQNFLQCRNSDWIPSNSPFGTKVLHQHVQQLTQLVVSLCLGDLAFHHIRCLLPWALHVKLMITWALLSLGCKVEAWVLWYCCNWKDIKTSFLGAEALILQNKMKHSSTWEIRLKFLKQSICYQRSSINMSAKSSLSQLYPCIWEIGAFCNVRCLLQWAFHGEVITWALHSPGCKMETWVTRNTEPACIVEPRFEVVGCEAT